MKSYYLILILFFSLCFNQTRSVIFNTGSPESLEHGYTINSNQSVANRISVMNNYVLEAMAFYMTLSSESGTVNISIREDNNGVPGELVNGTSEWIYDLDPMNLNAYNVIVTTDLCIYLDASNMYWWTIKAETDETEALWVHSNNSYYTVAISDGQDNWESSFSQYAGSGGVWAEQIYDAPFELGDVNFDFLLNVVDIVSIIGHIMESNQLPDEALIYADLNIDGLVNVVDIVQLVNTILIPLTVNPNFTLEDINPASEYYTNSIGPSFFEGQVSCYYFGKQG